MGANTDDSQVCEKIIDCLIEVQRELIDENIPEKTDENRRELARSLLNNAIEQVGGSYEVPSKEVLKKAVHWMMQSLPEPKDPTSAQVYRERVLQYIESFAA